MQHCTVGRPASGVRGGRRHGLGRAGVWLTAMLVAVATCFYLYRS